jgi:hypothetical protein
MAGSPTCPTNNNYKQEYLAIKYDYDTQCSTMTDAALDSAISNLDTKVKETASTTTPTQTTEADLSAAFQPIVQYYANLASIKKRLNNFLECSSVQLQDKSTGSTLNEERYYNRANPQDAVMPRELVFGLFSQLRPSSVPFVMAAGVFMSCLSLLIIFQMLGFTGEIHASPAVMQAYGLLTTPGAVPLYQNPMVLSGISIILAAAVIILGVMYYRSKNLNSR